MRRSFFLSYCNKDKETMDTNTFGDFFVLPGYKGKLTHTLFRFAAIIGGFLVLYKGIIHCDHVLQLIGLLTVIVDTFTFTKSMCILKKCQA